MVLKRVLWIYKRIHLFTIALSFKVLGFFNVLVKVRATVKRLEYGIPKERNHRSRCYSLNLRLAAPFPYFARATHHDHRSFPMNIRRNFRPSGAFCM
ncbi:hypothetical protein L596_003550 [Steinernema carpocapsae]|uniref:Uncharacterized protein n=1 Tax=Steinernema carpocapsae TaxID=34508 RepID=A0A4U8UT25_STECR|nr:hypothetical protein L596_003550 [Steinernema carpocapsae]